MLGKQTRQSMSEEMRFSHRWTWSNDRRDVINILRRSKAKVAGFREPEIFTELEKNYFWKKSNKIKAQLRQSMWEGNAINFNMFYYRYNSEKGMQGNWWYFNLVANLQCELSPSPENSDATDNIFTNKQLNLDCEWSQPPGQGSATGMILTKLLKPILWMKSAIRKGQCNRHYLNKVA